MMVVSSRIRSRMPTHDGGGCAVVPRRLGGGKGASILVFWLMFFDKIVCVTVFRLRRRPGFCMLRVSRERDATRLSFGGGASVMTRVSSRI